MGHLICIGFFFLFEIYLQDKHLNDIKNICRKRTKVRDRLISRFTIKLKYFTICERINMQNNEIEEKTQN